MKKFFILTLAAAALSLTACKNGLEPTLPDSDKEMISFSMSDAQGRLNSGAMTRAGFTATTQIIARIESFRSATVGGDRIPADKRSTRTVLSAQSHDSHSNIYSDVTTSDPRYWDDCFGRYANLSVYAVAVPTKVDITNNSTTLLNLVNYGGENVSTTNTVWKKEGSTPATQSNNNITWKVEQGVLTAGTSITGQTAVTIENEDLCYSNNIQDDATLGKDGRYVWSYTAPVGYPEFSYTPEAVDKYPNFKDGYMRFVLPGTDETAPGHFDKGHLIFNHALTRLTVNLKRGDGFNAGASYFKFQKVGTDDSNVKIIGVPVQNTLNIKEGTWSTTPGDITTGPINKMSPVSPVKTDFDYTLMAQFIPGYTFTQSDNTNVLEFTIDDNTYYVTQQMIWKALNDNAGTGAGKNGLATDATAYTMEQGKNYVLDITVKKTGIVEVTATLVPWGEVVAANIDATNSYVKISTTTMGAKTEKCDHFELYRLDAGVNDIYTDQNGVTLPAMTNWGGNYTDHVTPTKTTGYETNGGLWQTPWYWESNKSFYHFRTVDRGVNLQETSTATDDYFNVYSGPVNDTWTVTGEAPSLVYNISTAVNDKNYNDYHWGAPMKTGAKLTYNPSNGYTDDLYYAIGSTDDNVNIIEQHMMSTVHFVIHTGKKADGTSVANGQVSLLNGSNKATRLTLTNFAGDGQVKMGNGLVTPSNTIISSDIPVPGATTTEYSSNVLTDASMVSTAANYLATNETGYKVTKAYNYRVVPQELHRGSTAIADETVLTNFVGLTIVTPDDNQYYVIKNLYGVLVETLNKHGESKEEHSVGSQITRWYPGYDYTYHIYINKKQIEAITCTVADWITVEGNVGDINLEN